MASSINKNTSLSLLDMPPEMIHRTFECVIAGGGVSSLVLLNRRCKEIADDILTSYLNHLNLPNVNLPKGLVDLPSIIGRFDQSHPVNTDPKIIFHELIKTFANLGATVPKGNPPLTISDLEVLQCQAKGLQDTALSAIWPKIVEKIQGAPQLQTADAIRAWLTDPTNAPVLNGVTDLNLSGLKLGVVPTEIARFTQLQKLYLMNNKLTYLPIEIGALTQLREFWCCDNQLSALPKEIWALIQLRELNLSNNPLRSLPKEISSLTQLIDLRISNNQLSLLPNGIGALIQLTTLSLSGNQLSLLPNEIRAFTQLKVLNLSDNQLSSLPDGIWALAQLNLLNLVNNKLSSLPPGIGALTQLSGLFLANNQLSILPKEIGALKKLTKLDLSNNQLSALPKEIGALKNLDEFKLLNNQLCSLTDKMSALTALQTLELHGNPLMFISETVRNSNMQGLKFNGTIINYKAELLHKSISPLSKLYLFIIQKKSQSKIKAAFYTLSSEDRILIWQYADQGNHRYIDDSVFDDMRAFCLGVRKAICTKLERLSQEKKSQVYDVVSELAGWQGAERHAQALSNLPRLADVLARLENPAQFSFTPSW